MHIQLMPINIIDKETVLSLFKEAAEKISRMEIDHWQYWKNPPKSKVEWVEEGIRNNEFFFIKNEMDDLVGMVRILKEDLMYWGQQKEEALYVHSLVVRDAYNGNGIGRIVLEMVGEEAKRLNRKFLRLDADSRNPKLCAYYENMGFHKVGTKALSLSVNNLYEKSVK
ncbi:GNAT family N-acetyltransferase [Alkaliflexus imshenetskii]|uniref:GNAT family N-acetyltransferase n=1 Tax=Alkaliflexus imshenetskii TaxID=286730 RepID=UPI00047B65E2|nr:GNAT family N-acetyltransferase [Alkaliflexus imshenetskii]